MYCTVDSSPQAALSLYRDKQLVATSSSHAAPSQRVRVTTTRNSLKLEIQKVLPEDEAEYQCVATNTYGNASIARFFGAQSTLNLPCGALDQPGVKSNFIFQLQ